MSAADAIRASIEALATRQRTQWHIDDAGNVFAEQVNAWLAEATNREVAAYMALMDPTVATALADLLDALKEPTEKPVNAIAWLDEIVLAGRALEAAVDRSGT